MQSAPGSKAPEVKAVAFNTTVAALQKMLSAHHFQAYLAALPTETRRHAAAPPPVTEWIDAAHIGHVIDMAYRIPFANDLRKVFEMSRLGMQGNLKGVHRIFVRLLDPGYLVSRAAQVWTTYYRNHGTVTATERSANHVVCHYKGVSLGCPSFWEAMRGSTYALIEASRVADVKVELCDGGGALDYAYFHSSWAK